MSEISKFYQQMEKSGVRYAYQYKVSLYPSDQESRAALGADFNNRVFNFYAQGFTLPGRTMNTADVNFQGMKFKLPNNMEYGNSISIEVNCDKAMNVRTTCENWMNIYAKLSNGGGGKKLIPNFKVRLDLLNSYLDEDTDKQGPSKDGPDTKVYELFGCYPTSIGDVTFGQDNTAIAKFTMGLIYQYYEEIGTDTGM